jgi:hypothetical protein
MDWQPTEMMTAIGELANQILRDNDDPWSDLVEAQVLEVADILDVATLLVAVGRGGARAPVFETLCLGWPARQAGVVASDAVATAGLHEPGARDPRLARTEVRDGRAYGTKTAVPAIDKASLIVIPATDGVYAVRPEDCGVEVGVATNDESVAIVTMDGAPAQRLGGPEVLTPWLQRVEVGLCALLLGLSQQGLRLTAKYVRERKQFGKPIGAFQAVGQRAADAWIHTQAMEVTLWSAAWQVSEGLDAERAIRIARWQASEGSHFTLAAAQHLHGGMGYDRDYPLHRYFLTAKHWEHTLGGPAAQLQRLGDMLASD